jgi:hypothetical protein
MTATFFLMLLEIGKCLIFAQCLQARGIWPGQITGINITDYLLHLALLRCHAYAIAVPLLCTHCALAADTGYPDDRVHKAENAFNILDGQYLAEVDFLLSV